jgi:hypothetical protein
MGEAKRRGNYAQRISLARQRQFKENSELNNVSDFLEKGLKLEVDVLQQGKAIRELAKIDYHTAWLDARLILLSISQHVFSAKNLIPGKTSDDISHILILLTAFYQGTHATETLISEGQYIKAATVLKQDYEILARIYEVKKGTAKVGQTPQIRYLEEEVRGYYGDLNKVAHPSNQEMLENLMQTLSFGTAQAISHVPVYNKDYSMSLYELHIWLIYIITQQHLILFAEMYSASEPIFIEMGKWFLRATELLKTTGFRFKIAQNEIVDLPRE